MAAVQQSAMYDYYDLVIVGAGLSGLVAAARYLQAHPDCKLAILEQDYCLGGVWSKRRNFDNFWSQTAYGIAEFADMAMTQPPAEDYVHGLFRAIYTTGYLEEYADHIYIAGKSLRDRIQFNASVCNITKRDDRWLIPCTSPTLSSASRTLCAAKMIIANGMTPIPRFPNLPGQQDFQGTILHSRDFGDSAVLANSEIQHVAVIGGGKSAADMVYEAVRAGKHVSWIIRKTGDGSTGPGFFAPADVNTPYRNAGQMAQTRLMTSLQPCFMVPATWWTWFIQRTRVGLSLVKAIFGKADQVLQDRAAYIDRSNAKGFRQLQCETSLFWQNGVGGVLHHDDFYDLVAEKVQVYRGRVKRLIKNELFLDDDATTHFPCDAILCGTGWDRDSAIFSKELEMRLGLPFNKTHESLESDSRWAKMVAEADEQILEQFPILRKPPLHTHIAQSNTPYRLYRGMAPLHEDTILFINHVTVANKMFGAEAQAMWAVAYFDRNIVLPSIEQREKNIAVWIAWCSRRYLSNGQLGNYAAFDGVAYVDTLLDDMGLTEHRSKGRLQNFFAPILPSDLGRAWHEYLKSRG